MKKNGTILVLLLLVVSMIGLVIGRSICTSPLPPEEEMVAPVQSEQTKDKGDDKESLIRAKILNVIKFHPSPAVRKLYPLFERGDIKIATSAQITINGKMDSIEPDPNSAQYSVTAKTLVVDPEIVSGSHFPPCYAQVVLRHELKHVEDDLAGMPEPEYVNGGEDVWMDAVQKTCHAEWRASIAQHELDGKGITCEGMEDWNMNYKERCAYFKQWMLVRGSHIPKEIFRRSPAIRKWVENVDCKELEKPF